MPQFVDKVYTDFSGGQRLDKQALSLADNELLLAHDVQFNVNGIGLRQRNGWQSWIVNNNKNEDVVSMVRYLQGAGDTTAKRYTVYGTTGALYQHRDDVSVPTQLEATAGPFAFAQWKDKVFNLHATRVAPQPLESWDGTTLTGIVGAPNGTSLTVHDTRMWIGGIPGNERVVQFSALNDHTSWPAANQLVMDDAVGGRVTGVVHLQRGVMVIMMTTGLYRFLGSPVTNPQLEQLSTQGMIVEDAWALSEEGVYYLSNDGLRFTDGEISLLVNRSIINDASFGLSAPTRGNVSMTWNAKHQLLLLVENTSGAQRCWAWTRIRPGQLSSFHFFIYLLAESEWRAGASNQIRCFARGQEANGEFTYAGVKAQSGTVQILRMADASLAADSSGVGNFAAGISKVRLKNDLGSNAKQWKTPVATSVGGTFTQPRTFTANVYVDGQAAAGQTGTTYGSLLAGVGAPAMRRIFEKASMPRGRAISTEVSWPHTAGDSQLDLVEQRVRLHDERAPEDQVAPSM